MDKTKKVIVVLLVLAILFSATSIFISLSVSKLETNNTFVGKAISNGDAGGVSFVVEKGGDVNEG